ncbi:MAG: hypothetical protein AAGA28_06730 [Pseudomonadota bacterium]
MRRCLIWALTMLALTCAVQAQDPVDESALDGIVESISRAAPDEPVKVGVGIKIMQIAGVDQQAENFTVVARIRLAWNDPELVFDIADYPLGLRSMSVPDFKKFARENGINVPLAIFENVQKRTFTKSAAVGWNQDGDAFVAGEYVLTLQAPDFNFRQYPFDKQKFYVRLLLNAPTSFFQYVPLEGFSGLASVLGEEEWIIRSTWEEVDETEAIAGWQASRFSFGMSADRHLVYYWMRIFFPLLLLSLVTWANLFLEEYRRRIDIAGANLLAFIAFSFTISGDLPRLGYVTFLDALLMAMFLVNAASVAYNVMLRKLSITERDAKARHIDWHVTYWGYPLMSFLIVLSLVVVFFV